MLLISFIAGRVRPFCCVAVGPNGHTTTVAEWTGCNVFISLLDQVGQAHGRTHGERAYHHQAQHKRT